MPVDLIGVLRREARPVQAGRLVDVLGISRPTLSRAVQAAGAGVISAGRARRTRHAARRALYGSLAPLPVYRVDGQGDPHEIAQLHLAHPHWSWVDGAAALGWPLDDDMRDGWFEGLPYPMLDMRPQGFLGRHFARAHAAALDASDDPTTWSDDQVLQALRLYGVDLPGDLIVGSAACRQWLDHVAAERAGQAPAPVSADSAEAAYPALALQAMAQGVAGSSAGGEFPKFPVLLQQADGRTQAALVKFSGADDSPGSRRWADLLVCEHLAADTVRTQLGLEAARSRIVQAAGRCFLEVLRFDRQGALGRSPLLSWEAVNSALFGLGRRPWTEVARRLATRRWLDPDDAARLCRLWHFGQLIGNDDMHDGNLSFQPGGPGLRLAPVYDMVPMRFAPLRGIELPERAYTPSLPLPEDRDDHAPAAQAAIAFWHRAADDDRISADFRRRCAAHAATLEQLVRR